MDLFQAILYGILQGLTEFLPISSSGHLFLLPTLFHWQDAGAGFTAVIQLGTLAAVLIYFREDLVRIIGAWFKSLGNAEIRKTQDAKLGWGVFWGTLPIMVLGFLLKDHIDTTFRNAYIVGTTLIVFGILMGVSEKMGTQKRDIKEMETKDGIIMGLWQCLALVPGSSRSGSTITGGLFGGMTREAAARFSFLLSVPSILVSGIYKLYSERHSLLESGKTETIVATVVSFIVGYAAIAFLMKFLQTKSTMVFVVYRVVLGLLVLGLAFGGVIEAQPKKIGDNKPVTRFHSNVVPS